MTNTLKKYFVLPDFQNTMKGFVKPDGEPLRPQDEQVLTMEAERFSVPELLFNPSDIGMEMAGIAEATAQSVRQLHEVSSAKCHNVFFNFNADGNWSLYSTRIADGR